jgi:hypothetical protein
MRTLSLLPLVVALLAACGGGDNADVAGTYSINLTNRDNGCMLQDWMVGNQTTGVVLVVTQNDDAVTATVTDPLAIRVGLQLWLGSNVFSGSVSGNDIDLSIIGTNAATMGNCTYTYNALIDGTITGDALAGHVTYTAATNDNTDCTPLEGCRSIQEFNGTRPPPP